MRRCLLVSALVVLSLAAAACEDEGTVRVHSIKFTGTKAIDSSKLEQALATRASSRLPWGKKAYFDRGRFDADLKRIQVFYADRGYPDARVTGFDVKLNDKQDEVDIAVTVAEGEPVKVAAVNFVGFEVLPADRLENLPKQMPLKVEAPRDRQLVVSTREMALNELRDNGYPYAKVTTSEDDGPGGKTATVTFKADPGKIAHFGPVMVQGNKSVDDRVIEREVTFKAGDLYRRSVLQETQRRLYRLELFQFVNVEPLDTEAQPTDVPTRITVAEGNHQRVNFGVGYGTEEKGRVDAEYHHLNFLGDARSAGVHGRYSSLDRGLRVDFTQPYFFAPHFSLGGEAQDWHTYTPAYKSVVIGAKATLAHRGDGHLSWSVFISSEQDTSSISELVLNDPQRRSDLIALGLDPRTGEQSGTSNADGFDVQYSTADNLLNPKRGYQLAFHFEAAGKLLPGTFNYYATSGDARHYLPLGDNVVLASRAQFGNISPPGGDEALVPFAKKYFLGGATSVRGWGRFELSPLSEGLPIGGDSLLAFSEEIRAPLVGNVGGVLFLDAGNVWAGSREYNLNDLRYAVGTGLRYETPVGPLRLDFGYQLNPIPGLIVNGVPQDRRWRLHFSIGQAF